MITIMTMILIMILMIMLIMIMIMIINNFIINIIMIIIIIIIMILLQQQCTGQLSRWHTIRILSSPLDITRNDDDFADNFSAAAAADDDDNDDHYHHCYFDWRSTTNQNFTLQPFNRPLTLSSVMKTDDDNHCGWA